MTRRSIHFFASSAILLALCLGCGWNCNPRPAYSGDALHCVVDVPDGAALPDDRSVFFGSAPTVATGDPLLDLATPYADNEPLLLVFGFQGSPMIMPELAFSAGAETASALCVSTIVTATRPGGAPLGSLSGEFLYQRLGDVYVSHTLEFPLDAVGGDQVVLSARLSSASFSSSAPPVTVMLMEF